MLDVLPWLSIEIGIDPVAFELGPITINWYGIGYVFAIAFGLFFAVRYARERGLDPDLVWDVAPWAILAGLAGGRLYYVAQNDPLDHLRDPGSILAVWDGGMAFFGAIMAVAATVLFFSWFRNQSLGPMIDVAALFALMGQPIGRIGNIINGDVIGPATDLPWGFVYTHPDSFAPDMVTAYHPAGLYALVMGVALIAILYPLRNKFAYGWFFHAYLAAYCVSQLIVFMWRSEPVVALGLQQAQVTALVILAIQAVVLTYLWRQGSRPWINAEAAPA